MFDTEGGGYIERLKSFYEKQNNKNIIFNLGIPGDTTTGMIKRFYTEASVRNPDLIIITTGLNDTRMIGSIKGKHQTELHKFKENIRTLITLSKTLADVIFLSFFLVHGKRTTLLLFWNRKYYYLLEDVTEYTNAGKHICDSEHIPYLNIYNPWMKSNFMQYLFEDGLHANTSGHKTIFKLLKAFLSELYLY